MLSNLHLEHYQIVALPRIFIAAGAAGAARLPLAHAAPLAALTYHVTRLRSYQPATLRDKPTRMMSACLGTQTLRLRISGCRVRMLCGLHVPSFAALHLSLSVETCRPHRYQKLESLDLVVALQRSAPALNIYSPQDRYQNSGCEPNQGEL